MSHFFFDRSSKFSFPDAWEQTSSENVATEGPARRAGFPRSHFRGDWFYLTPRWLPPRTEYPMETCDGAAAVLRRPHYLLLYRQRNNLSRLSQQVKCNCNSEPVALCPISQWVAPLNYTIAIFPQPINHSSEDKGAIWAQKGVNKINQSMKCWRVASYHWNAVYYIAVVLCGKFSF